MFYYYCIFYPYDLSRLVFCTKLNILSSVLNLPTLKNCSTCKNTTSTQFIHLLKHYEQHLIGKNAKERFALIFKNFVQVSNISCTYKAFLFSARNCVNWASDQLHTWKTTWHKSWFVLFTKNREHSKVPQQSQIYVTKNYINFDY